MLFAIQGLDDWYRATTVLAGVPAWCERIIHDSISQLTAGGRSDAFGDIGINEVGVIVFAIGADAPLEGFVRGKFAHFFLLFPFFLRRYLSLTRTMSSSSDG